MITGTNLKEGTRFLLRFLTGHANTFPIYQSRLMPQYASLRSTATSPCAAGKLREALAFFSSGPGPPDYSFYLKLLQLCIGTNAERQGHSTHGHLIINGFRSNVHLNTKLIIFYSKLGDMINARKVSDNMLERSVVSWTALISGYSQNRELEEALKVFSEMHKDGVRSNQYTYGSALRACTGLVCLDRGKQIQACAQKSRFVKNLFVQSALVDLYSKCGRMEDAFSVFSSMMERDLVSWNAIIGGFVIQGFHDNAFYMFHLMLREGMPKEMNFVLIFEFWSSPFYFFLVELFLSIILTLNSNRFAAGLLHLWKCFESLCWQCWTWKSWSSTWFHH